MRSVPVLVALVVAGVLPAPAAAEPCGGVWTSTATCAFTYGGGNVTLLGAATRSGAIASVSVDVTSAASTVQVSCSSASPEVAFFSCTGPLPFPVGALLVCRVTGVTNPAGSFACVSR